MSEIVTKGIEYDEIKRKIVRFLDKNGEPRLTRKQTERKFRLFPAQAYFLLLELVNEEKIKKEGRYYFI